MKVSENQGRTEPVFVLYNYRNLFLFRKKCGIIRNFYIGINFVTSRLQNLTRYGKSEKSGTYMYSFSTVETLARFQKFEISAKLIKNSVWSRHPIDNLAVFFPKNTAKLRIIERKSWSQWDLNLVARGNRTHKAVVINQYAKRYLL